MKKLWTNTVLAVCVAAALTTQATAADRLPLLTPGNATPEQLIARGKSEDPIVNVMARSPNVQYAVQALSNAARTINNKANVPEYLDELAVIMVAKFWGHQMMWAGHLATGMKNGLSEAAKNSAAQNKKLAGMKPDEIAVFDFTHDVLYNHAVSDATYDAVLKVMGSEQNLVNLMGTISAYQFSCMVGNVAGGKPGLKEGFEPPPFKQTVAK